MVTPPRRVEIWAKGIRFIRLDAEDRDVTGAAESAVADRHQGCVDGEHADRLADVEPDGRHREDDRGAGDEDDRDDLGA